MCETGGDVGLLHIAVKEHRSLTMTTEHVAETGNLAVCHVQQR
jgi:hypothetical protein